MFIRLAVAISLLPATPSSRWPSQVQSRPNFLFLLNWSYRVSHKSTCFFLSLEKNGEQGLRTRLGGEQLQETWGILPLIIGQSYLLLLGFRLTFTLPPFLVFFPNDANPRGAGPSGGPLL